jgi:hypothetical protein
MYFDSLESLVATNLRCLVDFLLLASEFPHGVGWMCLYFRTETERPKGTHIITYVRVMTESNMASYDTLNYLTCRVDMPADIDVRSLRTFGYIYIVMFYGMFTVQYVYGIPVDQNPQPQLNPQSTINNPIDDFISQSIFQLL